MTVELLVSILVAGALGSVHCVAMCGAFATAAARGGLRSSGLYSAGRLTSYAALGALAGGIGAGLQITLSGLRVASVGLAVVLGIALVVAGVRAMLPPASGPVGSSGPLVWLYTRLVPMVQSCLGVRRREEAYLLGVLNGLLPCPVTMPLLLVAVASGSPVVGMALLAALGLGTTPAMLAAAHAGGRALHWLTRRGGGEQAGGAAWLRSRAVGVAFLALGLLTLVRPLLQGGAMAMGHMH